MLQSQNDCDKPVIHDSYLHVIIPRTLNHKQAMNALHAYLRRVEELQVSVPELRKELKYITSGLDRPEVRNPHGLFQWKIHHSITVLQERHGQGAPKKNSNALWDDTPADSLFLRAAKPGP